jgi:hypothetical protein
VEADADKPHPLTEVAFGAQDVDGGGDLLNCKRLERMSQPDAGRHVIVPF